MLHYKITKQFLHNRETDLAKFANIEDAAEFMEAKVRWDHKTKVNAIYRLYEDEELLETIDASKQEILESSASSTGKSQQFGPTPFSSSPKPAGANLTYKKDNIFETDDDL